MTSSHDQLSYAAGTRRFGRINRIGLQTLALREILRFMSVWQQTLLAPLITAALFLTVFSLALGQGGKSEIMGLDYLAFLGPGILMMTVIQNSFANTSSSIISAKMQGNIIDTLMPPLSAGEIVTGYLTGSLVRAGAVAFVIWLGMALVLGQGVTHPVWAILFVALAALLLGGLGIIAGIVAQKFDQMAVVTNFVVAPLSFLSGTFYSIDTLPSPFRESSYFNPIFYLIDGARYGFSGASDASPWLGLLVSGTFTLGVIWLARHWLHTGYRMKP